VTSSISTGPPPAYRGAEETRKAALLAELAGLDGAAGLRELEAARTRHLLQAKAADVRGALDRNPAEARAVLAAFVERITLEHFRDWPRARLSVYRNGLVRGPARRNPPPGGGSISESAAQFKSSS
jgi:hypothetical protein